MHSGLSGVWEGACLYFLYPHLAIALTEGGNLLILRQVKRVKKLYTSCAHVLNIKILKSPK